MGVVIFRAGVLVGAASIILPTLFGRVFGGRQTLGRRFRSFLALVMMLACIGVAGDKLNERQHGIWRVVAILCFPGAEEHLQQIMRTAHSAEPKSLKLNSSSCP